MDIQSEFALVVYTIQKTLKESSSSLDLVRFVNDTGIDSVKLAAEEASML
jgi:hypothetical protein